MAVLHSLNSDPVVAYHAAHPAGMEGESAVVAAHRAAVVALPLDGDSDAEEALRAPSPWSEDP